MSASAALQSPRAGRAARPNAPARRCARLGLLGAGVVFGLQSLRKYCQLIRWISAGGRRFPGRRSSPSLSRRASYPSFSPRSSGPARAAAFSRYYDPVDKTRAIRDAMIDRWVIVVRAVNSDALARSRDIMQDCDARMIEEAEL